MEVNFSDTNPVAEILRLQPSSWLVLTQSGISINLASGEVIIPENLELSAASREFWNSVGNLAKTRISELEAQLAEEKQKVADLENPAAFGWQCYQDRCENAYVEQSVVKRMETALQVAREALCLSPTGDDYRLMAISLSGTALKQDMQEHIALYEEKRSKALARIEEVSRD